MYLEVVLDMGKISQGDKHFHFLNVLKWHSRLKSVEKCIMCKLLVVSAKLIHSN